MKRTLVFFALICSGFLFATIVESMPIAYRTGAAHVSPAYTLAKNSSIIGFRSQNYFKGNAVFLPDGENSSTTFTQLSGGLGFFYGFTSNPEFGIGQVLYQKINMPDQDYNFPGDLFMRAKFGSFGAKGSPLCFGVQMDLRIPTAETYNIPLDLYSSGRIGLGVTGLCSIISEPDHPESGVNITANLGLFNHNDLGLLLTESIGDTNTVKQSTREILYGFSFSYNLERIGCFAELYGRSFVDQPPVTAHTRENSIYCTPGVTFRPGSRVQFNLSADFRILGNKDETKYADDPDEPTALPRYWEKIPNLPAWRANFGIIVTLGRPKALVRKTQSSPQDTQLELRKNEERLYAELAREREKTESVEFELDRIKQERQRMEDLLKRLRNILDYPAVKPDETVPTKSEEPE